MNLVYGRDDVVIPWICHNLQINNPGPCVAIGIAKDNLLIGGALYNNHHLNIYGIPQSIELSFVTIDKHWATRGIVSALLSYPFIQLKVKRVQLTIRKRDMHTRRFVERLGFTLEGVARKAHHTGQDAAVYSMLPHECRWVKLNEKSKSKIQ